MNRGLFFLGIVVVAAVVADDSCISKGVADLRLDPTDCSVFYLCANNKLVKFSCINSVFDPQTKTCVPKGSIWDKCSPQAKSKTVECTPGSTAVIAHPTKCAQYYNCSDHTEPWRWPKFLKECPYPQLFNPQTARCEHYLMVECGNRKEPFYECEYELNLCRSAHCIPCNVRYASCKGMPDGLNHWRGRDNSPYFAVCKNDRTVFQGMCPQIDGVYLFDAQKRTCVKMS